MIRNSIQNIAQYLIHINTTATAGKLATLQHRSIFINGHTKVLDQPSKSLCITKQNYQSNKNNDRNSNSNDNRNSNSNTKSKQCPYYALKLVFATIAATSVAIVVISNITSTSSSYISADFNLIHKTASCDINDDNNNHGHVVPFTRNFVADAAQISSPAVVNIMTQIEGFMMVGASAGSGFIISKDGYIVTNAHVVSQSKDGRVFITMWNGHKLEGFVHSLDTKSDVALVKVSPRSLSGAGTADDLPVAKLGSSSTLRVGEFVVALGSPLQLQNTVTFGIVSAVARHGTELGIAKSRTEYIQTDAAINVGNSGGPLVNLNGEVIGVNTMKVNVTGISFAIPIDTVMQVVKQLKANKKVVRPFIGMKMANLSSNNPVFIGKQPKNKHGDPVVADSATEGVVTANVLVLEVEPSSPAQQSGLQTGDLIIATDGKPVRHVRDVLECIGLEVGKVIEMKVLRRSSSRSSSGSSGSGGGYFNWGYGSGSGSDSGAASNNNYDVITLRVKSAPESR